MRTVTLTLIATLLVPCAALGAQTAPLAPGARVRITAPSRPHVREVGTLVALEMDSIRLRGDGQMDSLSIPLTQVTRIEVSEGIRSHGRQGMGIGFLTGATMGVAIGLSEGDDWFTPEAKAAMGGVMLGVAGAIVGGLVGLASKTEQWRRVPVTGSVSRVGVSPRGGGVALSLRF